MPFVRAPRGSGLNRFYRITAAASPVAVAAVRVVAAEAAEVVAEDEADEAAVHLPEDR